MKASTEFPIIGSNRRRVVQSLSLLLVLAFVVFSVAVGQVLKGDSKSRIVYTSPVQLSGVNVLGYRTGITDSVFKDALSLISGSVYSYQVARQFDSVGQWRLKFEYTDVNTGTYYEQWQTILVDPDTLSQQGAASALTPQAIWHYADGTDTGRTVFGFGGTGNRKTTLTIKDGSAVPIQSVEVRIKTTSGNAHKGGSKLTDANGVVVFYLPTSTNMTVSLTHNNYSFSATAFNTNANTTDTSATITGTLFDPGSPPSARLVRVWGRVYDVNFNVAIGTIVTAELIGARKVWFDGVALTPYVRKDTTDATGYWELNLIPNDSLVPTFTTYKMVMSDTTGILGEYSVEVPGESTGVAWKMPRQ